MKIICVYNEKEDLLNVLFGKPELKIELEKDHETGCELELTAKLSQALWRCLKKTYGTDQIAISPFPDNRGYAVGVKNAMDRKVEMSLYGVGNHHGRLYDKSGDNYTKDAAWVIGSITESMCEGRGCQGCPCRCESADDDHDCVAAFISRLDAHENIKIL